MSKLNLIIIISMIGISFTANCQNVIESNFDGKILFTKNREIHMIDPDGKNLTQLTNHKVPGHTPISLSASVSQSGSLAYIYDPINHGLMSTFLMNNIGGDSIRISKEPASGISSTWSSTISPNGRYIVFASTRSSNVEVYRMDSDGSNIVNISNTRVDEEFPKWSPDSSQIIYTSNNSIGGSDIVTTDINGLKKRILVRSKFKIRNVAYSKDGNNLVYCVPGDRSSQLMIANADGTNSKMITKIHKWTNLSFSPDNKKVTFVSTNGYVSTINIDGTELKELVKGKRPFWSFNR